MRGPFRAPKGVIKPCGRRFFLKTRRSTLVCSVSCSEWAEQGLFTVFRAKNGAINPCERLSELQTVFASSCPNDNRGVLAGNRRGLLACRRRNPALLVVATTVPSCSTVVAGAQLSKLALTTTTCGRPKRSRPSSRRSDSRTRSREPARSNRCPTSHRSATDRHRRSSPNRSCRSC